MNKEEVTTKITEEDDLIREKNFTKESTKRKRTTSDPQSEAPLDLKMVKASTLLNDSIPETSFTVSEKTAGVAEESQDTLTESHKHYKSRSTNAHQSS